MNCKSFFFGILVSSLCFLSSCADTHETVVPVESIMLDKEMLLIEENKDAQFIVTIEPSDATDRRIEWTSEDGSVATVSKEGAQSPAIPRLSAAPKALPGGRIPLPAAAAPVQSRAAAQPPAAKSSRPAARAGWHLVLFWQRWCWDLSHAPSAWDLYKRYGFRNSGGKSESKIVWIV